MQRDNALLAHRPAHNGQLPVRQAAWYFKTQATFSEPLQR
jgi:hypothetical protein